MIPFTAADAALVTVIAEQAGLWKLNRKKMCIWIAFLFKGTLSEKRLWKPTKQSQHQGANYLIY